MDTTPCRAAHLATLLEGAVITVARRVAQGEGFTVKELMAEIEPAVR